MGDRDPEFLRRVKAPEEVWTWTLRHFLEVQEREGPPVDRWALIEDKRTGFPFSNTCFALLFLARPTR